MAHSLDTKEKARLLRRRGNSVKEIAQKLNIAIGTSSLWVRDIELDQKAIVRLEKRKLLKYHEMSLGWKRKREARDKAEEQEARQALQGLRYGALDCKIYAALLYWCEGGKTLSHGVQFSNSDPYLVSTFLKALRQGFGLQESKFRALVHVHEYHDEHKQKQFWSRATRIPLKQFYPSYLKPHTGKRKREGYPGCVAITYMDVYLARKLKALYKSFSIVFEKQGV